MKDILYPYTCATGILLFAFFHKSTLINSEWQICSTDQKQPFNTKFIQWQTSTSANQYNFFFYYCWLPELHSYNISAVMYALPVRAGVCWCVARTDSPWGCCVCRCVLWAGLWCTGRHWAALSLPGLSQTSVTSGLWFSLSWQSSRWPTRKKDPHMTLHYTCCKTAPDL